MVFLVIVTFISIVFSEATATEQAPAPADEPLTLPKAIQNVLKSALLNGKLYRGLRECAKALDRNQAAICILAENCDEQQYVKLVQALCARRDLPILQVESNKDLGQWAGLCQIDKDGTPRKIVSCSCVVISDVGNDLESYNFISEHIAKQNESDA